MLWLLGVLGAVYVASQQPEQPLALTIAQQPWTIWFVGPAAAAVTGRQLPSLGVVHPQRHVPLALACFLHRSRSSSVKLSAAVHGFSYSCGQLTAGLEGKPNFAVINQLYLQMPIDRICMCAVLLCSVLHMSRGSHQRR